MQEYLGNDQRKRLGCIRKYGGKGESNKEKRTKMLEFCLLIGNTWWDQDKEDKYTSVAEERNGKSTIDYITYTESLQRVIEEVKVEAKAELGTQHILVTALIKNVQAEMEEIISYNKIQICKL